MVVKTRCIADNNALKKQTSLCGKNLLGKSCFYDLNSWFQFSSKRDLNNKVCSLCLDTIRTKIENEKVKHQAQVAQLAEAHDSES